MRAYVPTLPAPRRLWVLARSLSKGLERIRAWIDCWAPFRSSDPIHAEAGLERPRATTVISRGYSRTIQVFSERPVDLQHTFSQWLSSVVRTGSEPFPDELKKAVEKLTGQVPWHFPLESYGRQFEFSSRNATALLHFVMADDRASVAVLDHILNQPEVDAPRPAGNRQSALLIHFPAG